MYRSAAFSSNGSTNCIHSDQSDEFGRFRSEALARVAGQISGGVFGGGRPSEPKPGEQGGDGDAEEAV
jgi:hypothetical protein